MNQALAPAFMHLTIACGCTCDQTTAVFHQESGVEIIQEANLSNVYQKYLGRTKHSRSWWLLLLLQRLGTNFLGLHITIPFGLLIIISLTHLHQAPEQVSVKLQAGRAGYAYMIHMRIKYVIIQIKPDHLKACHSHLLSQHTWRSPVL